MKIGNSDLEIIEEVGEWDYSWTIGALMRSESGDLYYAVDSGCSCTSFGDAWTSLDELTPVKSWHAAVELAKEDFSESEVVTFAERLMKAFK